MATVVLIDADPAPGMTYEYRAATMTPRGTFRSTAITVILPTPVPSPSPTDRPKP